MPGLSLIILMPMLFWVVHTHPVLAEKSTSHSRSEPIDDHRTGIPPGAFGNCSESYPIKGNFTTYSGERCIYHLPGQRFYNKTAAERCYATEADARQDGCRKSKR